MMCRIVPGCVIVVFFATLNSVSIGQDLLAERIYSWDFQRDEDQNTDLEPDGWRRLRDRQHPAYVRMQISPRDAQRSAAALHEQLLLARIHHAFQLGYWDSHYIPELMPPFLTALFDQNVLNNCLEIQMDGGAAELVSPSFPMDSRFSYNLAAELSSEALDGHAAWIELHLLDADGVTIELLSTRKVTHTCAWSPVTTGVTPDISHRLRWGRVHLKVEPTSQLLNHGIARFDSISIHRLPRLSLTTDAPHHIVRPGEVFSVNCLAMGLRGERSTVRFTLLDHQHSLIDQQWVQLEAVASDREDVDSTLPQPVYVSRGVPHSRVSSSKLKSSPGEVDARVQPLDHADGGIFDGQAVWELNLEQPGLYRVQVALGDQESAQHREILIGVMHQSTPVEAGPFGWSLSSLDGDLQPEAVPAMVSNFGAGWLKFPVWFDAQDVDYSDRLVTMIERLQAGGCECVGVIAQPPATQRGAFGDGEQSLPAINIFRQTSVWEPLLEPVLTRIGLELDWFQLGADQDTSFSNVQELSMMLSDVRLKMQNYSQELKLAINWPWLDAQADQALNPWNAVNYTVEPQLTARELLEHVTTAEETKTDTWVSLDPLPSERYSQLDRVRDLTERMIAVKRSGAQAAFVSNPFDPQRGLFGSQQSVGELLIPWTQLVSAIGPAKYIGSIELPNGSYNHSFTSAEGGVMVIWNDAPTAEQTFLGESVSATDVWGRKVEVIERRGVNGAREQRVLIDRWPVLLRGVDTNVIRWKQNFTMLTANLASKDGVAQMLPLEIENTFEQSANGFVSMVSPTLLRDVNARMNLQLAAGTTRYARELPIVLRPDASAGRHELRFDFDVTTDKRYQFSTYRSLTLGMGEFEFIWDMTRKDPTRVALRIELVNHTEKPASFDCKFFPLGQPYQRFQVLDAQPGSTLREMTLSLTQQQSAQVWIRCEEIGTGRVLNYRLEL